MAGFDDNVAIMGEWTVPNPSSRTPFMAILGDNKCSKPIFEREPSLACEMGLGDGGKKDFSQPGCQLTEEKPSSQRGGLGERIAARAGFNAPRLNTEYIRPADFSFDQDVRSPYLISSPGLSPATLLDSPVFLSNPLVQPSPTTGKFPFLPCGNDNTLSSGARNRNRDDFFEDINTSFTFPPVSKSCSSFFPVATSKVATFAHQSFPSIEVSVESHCSLPPQNIEAVKTDSQNNENGNQKNSEIDSEPADQRIFETAGGSTELSPPLDEPQDEEQRHNEDLMAGGGSAPAEDGYNWRKYGQKQVKGSEYPRSYYKCTHPNCQVKKKVERSREGHIIEIIYKGAHNHPKPPPNRRSAIGPSNPTADLQLDGPEQPAPMDGDSLWASAQQAAAAGNPDNVEVTSAGSAGFEFANMSAPLQAQNGTQFESGDTVDASSTFSNDEDEDDRATHGSVSLGYDGEGDESESKRRKLEVYATEMSGATRAIREPRVVVQTTSDVDILDDGYRWRKYGQKVVKGNPNPRSYYKCTAPGCTVRKHVERASHDLKSVITTYEGKHNHDVPAARNSNHGNSGGSGNTVAGQTASAAQPHVHRPEPRSSMANRFERPASGSFGPFSLAQQMGPPPGFSFGITQPGLANLAMPGFGIGQGKLPVVPMHPYLAQHQSVSELGFMLPKGDPKVEPVSEPGLGLSSTSSIYQQIMSRLPLGPQM